MKPKSRIDTADEKVGRRVRIRRLELNLSQTQLGESVGVRFQQIQKYEKGINRVSAGRLEKIAFVLRVPVTYFFDNAAKQKAGSEPIMKFIDSVAMLRLVRAFDKIIDKKMRRAIIEMAEQAAAAGKR